MSDSIEKLLGVSKTPANLVRRELMADRRGYGVKDLARKSAVRNLLSPTSPGELSAEGIRTTPDTGFVDTFQKGLQIGGAQLRGDVNRFAAIANFYLGDEEATEERLRRARILEQDMQAVSETLAPFSDLVEQPTFSGGVDFAGRSLGQFTPMMISSLASGFAGMGASLLGRYSLSKAGRGALEEMFSNTIRKKVLRDEALDPLEDKIMNAVQGMGRTAAAGGIGGAGAQEFVVGAAQSLAELEDAGLKLTREEYNSALLMGVPQALIGTVADTAFAGSLYKLAFRRSAIGRLREKEAKIDFETKLAGTSKTKLNPEELELKRIADKVRTTDVTNLDALSVLTPEERRIYLTALGTTPSLGKLVRDVAFATGVSSGVEGVTELLQEELFIEQRTGVDPDYSEEEKKLRRAEAFFAGAIAGGGRAVVTSPVTSIFKQVRESMDLVKENRSRESIRTELTEEQQDLQEETANSVVNIVSELTGATARRPTPSPTVAEPITQLKAQIKSVLAGDKPGVFIPEGGPTLRDLGYSDQIGTANYIPSAVIPGVGIFISNSQDKINQVFQERENRSVLASEEYIAEFLGYTSPKRATDDRVLVVTDNDGNVVLEQATDKIGQELARKKAEALYPETKGYTISIQDPADILQDRQNAAEIERAKKGQKNVRPKYERVRYEQKPLSTEQAERIRNKARKQVGDSAKTVTSRTYPLDADLVAILEKFGIEGARLYINEQFNKAIENINADTTLSEDRRTAAIAAIEDARQRELNDERLQTPSVENDFDIRGSIDDPDLDDPDVQQFLFADLEPGEGPPSDQANESTDPVATPNDFDEDVQSTLLGRDDVSQISSGGITSGAASFVPLKAVEERSVDLETARNRKGEPFSDAVKQKFEDARQKYINDITQDGEFVLSETQTAFVNTLPYQIIDKFFEVQADDPTGQYTIVRRDANRLGITKVGGRAASNVKTGEPVRSARNIILQGLFQAQKDGRDYSKDSPSKVKTEVPGQFRWFSRTPNNNTKDKALNMNRLLFAGRQAFLETDESDPTLSVDRPYQMQLAMGFYTLLEVLQAENKTLDDTEAEGFYTKQIAGVPVPQTRTQIIVEITNPSGTVQQFDLTNKDDLADVSKVPLFWNNNVITDETGQQRKIGYQSIEELAQPPRKTAKTDSGVYENSSPSVRRVMTGIKQLYSRLFIGDPYRQLTGDKPVGVQLLADDFVADRQARNNLGLPTEDPENFLNLPSLQRLKSLTQRNVKLQTVPFKNLEELALPKNVKNIVVAGSRAGTDGNTFANYNLMKDVLDAIIGNRKDITIIEGDARGVDRLAGKYAKENNIPLTIRKADWDKDGKAAGYRRNTRMAREANGVAGEPKIGAAIIFWDGKSAGTEHMIKQALAPNFTTYTDRQRGVVIDEQFNSAEKVYLININTGAFTNASEISEVSFRPTTIEEEEPGRGFYGGGSIDQTGSRNLNLIRDTEEISQRLKTLPKGTDFFEPRRGIYESMVDYLDKDQAETFKAITSAFNRLIGGVAKVDRGGRPDEEGLPAPAFIPVRGRNPFRINGIINVWAGTNENAVLSNLNQRPFTYKGKRYFSVEHAYQSLKTGVFNPTIYNNKAWQQGKRVPKDPALPNVELNEAGIANNVALMEELMFLSFSQNEEAKQALLETGDALFTHFESRDVWSEVFPQLLLKVRKRLGGVEPNIERILQEYTNQLSFVLTRNRNITINQAADQLPSEIRPFNYLGVFPTRKEFLSLTLALTQAYSLSNIPEGNQSSARDRAIDKIVQTYQDESFKRANDPNKNFSIDESILGIPEENKQQFRDAVENELKQRFEYLKTLLKEGKEALPKDIAQALEFEQRTSASDVFTFPVLTKEKIENFEAKKVLDSLENFVLEAQEELASVTGEFDDVGITSAAGLQYTPSGVVIGDREQSSVYDTELAEAAEKLGGDVPAGMFEQAMAQYKQEVRGGGYNPMLASINDTPENIRYQEQFSKDTDSKYLRQKQQERLDKINERDLEFAKSKQKAEVGNRGIKYSQKIVDLFTSKANPKLGNTFMKGFVQAVLSTLGMQNFPVGTIIITDQDKDVVLTDIGSATTESRDPETGEVISTTTPMIFTGVPVRRRRTVTRENVNQPLGEAAKSLGYPRTETDYAYDTIKSIEGTKQAMDYIRLVQKSVENDPNPEAAKIIKFGNKNVIIVKSLPPGVPASQAQIFSRVLAMTHELGHAFLWQQQDTLLRGQANKMLEALRKAYEQDRDRLDEPYYEGERGFEEWYADQFAKAVFERTAKRGSITTTPAVTAYFTNLARKLIAFMKKISGVFQKRFGGTQNIEFESYLQTVRDKYREKNRAGNDGSIPVNTVFAVRDSMDAFNNSKDSIVDSAKDVMEKTRYNLKAPRSSRKHWGWRYFIYPADNTLAYYADKLAKNAKEKQLITKLRLSTYTRSRTARREQGTSFLNLHPNANAKVYNKFTEIFGLVDPTFLDQDERAMVEKTLLNAEDYVSYPDDASLRAEDPKAVKVRAFLAGFYKAYLKDVDISYLPNFFPRSLNIPALIQNKNGEQQKLASLLQERNPQARIDWDKYVRRMIIDDDAVIDNITDPSINKQEDLTDVAIGGKRERSEFFINIENKALRDIGVLKDPIESVREYFNAMVKRALYNRAYQTRIKDISPAAQNILDAKEIKFSKEEKAAGQITGWKAIEADLAGIQATNPALEEQVRHMLKGMLGKAGQDMSGGFRNVNSFFLFFNSITLLTLAPLASLPDLAGPMLFSADRGAFKDAKQVLKQYFLEEGGKEALREFAFDVGVVSADSLSMYYINAAEQNYMTPMFRKGTDYFFRYTFLEGFTMFSRVFATGMARQFLVRAAEAAKNGDKVKAEQLKGLNVTIQEIDDWVASGKVINNRHQRVKEAIAQFVDESIVRPNAAERPGWANNPYFAMVWQLKSFYYAYGKNIMGGLGRLAQTKAGQENMTAAVAPLIMGLVLLAPLTMLGLEIRELLKYIVSGGDQRKLRTNNMDAGEYSFEILDRSGVLGMGGLLIPMYEAGKYGDFPLGPALGPTFERIEDLIFDGEFKQNIPVVGTVL